MTRLPRILSLSWLAIVLVTCGLSNASRGEDVVTMTHGPMLGNPSATSMTVWARTSRPSKFEVRYGADTLNMDKTATAKTTSYADDNTGFVALSDLQPSTTYWYQVYIGNLPQGDAGSFRTWPSEEESRHPEYNPKGLFNLRFEFGSCANQNPEHGIGHSLPRS